MTEKRILLCGYFAFGSDDYGGQPVKAREMFWAFESFYGADNVHYVETKNWKKNPWSIVK